MSEARYLWPEDYMADPSAHVFNGKITIYPSHDRESGIPERDNGDHFDMKDYHAFTIDGDPMTGKVTDHGVIGGDRFGNYEGQLPKKKNRKYYECDVNYDGGHRGAERLIYSSDGLIYYTGDHYETFTLLYGEE